MKRNSTILLLLFAGFSTTAQFHFEAGINGNIPQSTLDAAHDIGAGLFIESKYRLSDKLDIGLFYSRNVFLGLSVEDDSYGVSTVSPLLATLTFKKQEEDITPYLGVGVGIYQVNSILEINSSVTDPFLKTTEFGFSPKVGIYLHFVDLGLSYHLAPRAQYFQAYLGVRFLHDK